MKRRVRRVYLYVIAGFSLLMLALFLADPGLSRDPVPPRDLRPMVVWLNEHPADWLTASALSSHALDSALPRRIELWHAAYELAEHLAPMRSNASAAFVRGGLFHWYELAPVEREQVLTVAAPLLRDEKLFGNLHIPLYQLTRDFGYLRRNSPPGASTLSWLSNLAITNGLFAEYRSLRQAERLERWKTFQSLRSTEHPSELIELLPTHLSAHDEPLVRGILEEFDHKPIDPQRTSSRAENLALFAMRHRVQPLSGLQQLVEARGTLSDPTRARLALALGNAGLASKVELTSPMTRTQEWVPYHLERAIFEARSGERAIAEAYLLRTVPLGIDARSLSAGEEMATALGDAPMAARYRSELLAESMKPRVWTETCGQNELCSRANLRQYVMGANETIRIEASVVQTDEVPPYIEIFADDALVAEGPVTGNAVFEAKVKPGLHRIEVRLVNPWTRNGVQRRVRLS